MMNNTMPKDFKPALRDILSSRGKTFPKHQGNRDFYRLIRANFPKYSDASGHKEKARVLDQVHDEIQASGTRFFRFDNVDEEWSELNFTQSRHKIAHAMRDAARYSSRSQHFKIAQKQVRLAKRSKRRRSILTIIEGVRPSPDTRQKCMGDILRLAEVITESLYSDSETTDSDYDSDYDSDSETIIDTEENDEIAQHQPDTSISETLNTGSFLLENEYPEETFSVSAKCLLGDYGDDYDSDSVDSKLSDSLIVPV